MTAVALPMEDGTLAQGWLVQTWTAKTNELYHTVVDGNGRVLDVESRTASDRQSNISLPRGAAPCGSLRAMA